VRIEGLLASANLFRILGVQPALGRNFLAEEDRPNANGSDAIILSHKLWKEHFGGDRQIIGRRLVLDGKPFTVVGVMPAGFDSEDESTTDFWVTAALLAESGPKPLSEERTMSFLHAVGRLKPGVSLPQAQADMDRVAAALVRTYPNDNPRDGVIIRGLQESNTADSRTTLLLLLGAAGAVFLIACADVGSLVLARATARQREMTVRAAVGAGKWRIIRQLLVEGFVLTTAGSLAGLWLAAATVPLLTRVLHLAPIATVTLDGRVLLFACLAAAIATAIFSIIPALQSTKTDLLGGLKESALNTSESRQHRVWNSVLVVAQIAIAMVLLSAAGLLTRSLIRLQQVDLGFEPSHVLTFPVTLPGERYPQDRRAAFFGQLVSRLEGLPGVVSAAASGDHPMSGQVSRTTFDSIAGREIPLQQRTGVADAPITPRYFQTIGVRIRRGREFTGQDQSGSQPVVIINETAARKYFGSADPLGQQVTPEMWNGAGSTTRPRTIVGVVSDIKQDIRYSVEPSVYWPITQIPSNGTMYLTVRAAVDPASIISGVRSVMHGLDKDIPLYNVFPLDHYVSRSLQQPRDTATLVALFAVLALLLTTVGLYGVISYSVARRTREIGVRMALGARPSRMVSAIVGRGLVLSLLGAAIGLPATIAMARLFRSLLFGVSPHEPLVLTAGASVLIVVALAASYIPARRAARVDPLTTLRYQ
jgi:putative ABC transport system permease protein